MTNKDENINQLQEEKLHLAMFRRVAGFDVVVNGRQV